MSLIQKLYEAQENKDLEKINEVLSEDYVWVQHSTGKHIPREELNKFFMSDEAPKTESQRIIYENDEIGVGHFFVSFKDGSRQAVLAVYIIKDGKIEDADIRVSCTCTRVPVIDGHTESVFVETEKEIDPALAKDTYDAYNKEISVAGLPSAPENYYAFHEDPTRPQPRMEREVGGGMTTTIGRVEKEELFDN